MNTGVGTGEEDVSIKCLDPSTIYTTLSVAASGTHTTFIPNCALGMVNVESPWDSSKTGPTVLVAADKGKIAVNCFSCKPGYKPTFSTMDGTAFNIVSTCTAITHCNTNNPGVWFNSCQTCTLLFTTDHVDYSACVDPSIVTATNCFAATSVGVCSICKKGYNLTDTNTCETWNWTNS